MLVAPRSRAVLAAALVCLSLGMPAPARPASPAPAASQPPAPALDDLIAKARAASGEPYRFRVVSKAREIGGGHTFDVTSESQGVKYVARRCERNVCSGFYFDGEHSFNTNINDTALPNSPLIDGLQLTLRAIASYEFAAPDFRANGGHLAMHGPVLRDGQRFWRVGVAPIRGALLDAVIDDKTGLVEGVISDERHVAFEFRDQRKIGGKLTLPYEIWLNGKEVEHFDERAIASGDLAAPEGVVPSFSGNAPVKMTGGPAPTPVVPCSIGGQNVSCLLDTGNSGLSMSLQLAEKLGIEPTGSFEIKGVGEYTTGVAQAPALTLGDATYPAAKYVILHDMHVYGYDVILGADAFAHAKVTIDYPDRTVAIGPATAPAGGTPIIYSDFIPVAFVHMGGSDVPLQIDTGDESTINLANDYYQQHPALFKPTGTLGVAGTGGGSEQTMGEISDVRFGDSTLGRIKIGATKALEADAAGHVGGGLLQHYTVTFDYAHDDVLLQPKAGDPIFTH